MKKTSIFSRIENATASDLITLVKEIKKARGERGIELCDLLEDKCIELGYEPEDVMYNGKLVKIEY